MIIVTALTLFVEELLDEHREVARLPSVAALRPPRCPRCGQPAHEPGKCLMIVGHGTYSRQVLGHPGIAGEAVVHVRRYLCRACRHTMSILSDWLHPHRWYSADVILEALRLLLVERRPEAEIRSRYCSRVSGSWRTLWRWARELLDRLWGWAARRLGFGGPALSSREAKQRLERLLTEAGQLTESSDAGCRAAPILLRDTVHDQAKCWPLARSPPEP